LALLGLSVVLFGAYTVNRSAFLSRRMGDLGCYARAGWAVRVGADLYAVPDDTRFHYNYPPLLAIVMTPLADPPPGADTRGMVPFGITVAICYLLSVGFLILATHLLAGALEATATDPAVRAQPRGCRRWWALRLLPALVCSVPIAHTLVRGQVNLLLLLLLCGSVAATVRGQRFQGGVWLAGAICLKIIPAFLLLFPLWRRDGRYLAGCAAGLLIGLVVIPVAVFGPVRAWGYYEELSDVLIRPGLGVGGDQSRAHELTTVVATDSQSLLAAMHNTLYLDRSQRPAEASATVRLVSGAIGALLTLVALLVFGRKDRNDPIADVLFFGALVVNMLLLSPVCHLHYFCLALPLVTALLAARWERLGTLRLGAGLVVLFTVYLIASIWPQIPDRDIVRDAGLAMYATLLLWGVACTVLWRRRHAAPSEPGTTRPQMPLAA
jgi:hypothetical protein